MGSGMFPDIVFNPHGFPSRMTIAMMIESMAGKSGAIHGKVHDATPFTFSEDPDNQAIDYFAQQLDAAGYNYYGTETLYSGVSGVEMRAEIFMGVIHYQRLRHMVSDKFQVRSLGPIDCVTRQPVREGRREVVSDSERWNGIPFSVTDQLSCSRIGCSMAATSQGAASVAPVDPSSGPRIEANLTLMERDTAKPVCVLCGSADSVEDFEVPFIFLHLVKELISINIKVKLGNSSH